MVARIRAAGKPAALFDDLYCFNGVLCSRVFWNYLGGTSARAASDLISRAASFVI